jgi:hypothetical protein
MGLALGYHSQAVAITPGAAISLGAKPLQLCGTEAQKKAHLPALARGERMFVFGLSEPGRGSDAANPQVTAVEEGRPLGHQRREVLVDQRPLGEPRRRARADQPASGPNGKRSTCFIVPMQQQGRLLPGDAGQEGLGAVLDRLDHVRERRGRRTTRSSAPRTTASR